MAQISQGLIDEYRRYLANYSVSPLTPGEYEQLFYAWEELQRLRAVKPLTFPTIEPERLNASQMAAERLGMERFDYTERS